MADQANLPDLNPAGSRRLKYGSNVALLMLIAIVIVGFLAYFTTQYHHPFDWSTGGLFTLSPQTRNLLKDLDAKKESIELVDSFSAEAASTDTELQEAQRVQDLLEQYVRQSSNIKIVIPKDHDELVKLIHDRYTGEIKPFKAAVVDFAPLATDLSKFFQSASDGLSTAAQTTGLSPDDAREAQSNALAFRTDIAVPISKMSDRIRKDLDSTTPNLSDDKLQISKVVDGIDAQLKQLTQMASPAGADGMSKVMHDYLVKITPQCTAILKQVDAYKDRLDKLTPLQSDDVLASIAPGTLAVMGSDSVKVLSSQDMFRTDTANSPDPQHPTMLFQGEQALSTAMMALVHPDKPKVVFITTSPQGLLTGEYAEISDRLAKANFDVSEWSPPGMPRPDQPPPPATPAASGKDSTGKPVVWVVLPPAAQSQQEMMAGMPPPDPRPVIALIKKHMDDGGNVLFLAEASSPMTMMGPGSYPYLDLIKPFGIDVKDKYDVMHVVRISEDTTRAIPEIDFDSYPNTPITGPLQSLTTLFVGMPSQMGVIGAPTVVDLSQPVPAGAKPMTIVETAASADIFASVNGSSPDPQFDPKTDLKSPISMGAASTRGTQKIVVLGNKLFLVNQLLQAESAVLQGGEISRFPKFPGNAELMINCVSWLSDNQNMIAVSPQANTAQRITGMSETESNVLRLASFFLPPALAMAIGTAVFFVRRRA